MTSGLVLFCVISALPCVLSQISLSLSAPSLVKPSQSMTLNCKVTGVPITDGSKMHAVNFIRQNSEYKLEFLAHLNYAQGTAYNPSLSNRISLSRDTSKNEVYLEVRALVKEDTATYFCASERVYIAGTAPMDIWGQGTMVLITSATQQAPSLFPLISCGTSQDSTFTVGCLAKDFLPETIDFTWNDKSNNSFTNGLLTYKPVLRSSGNYMASSQIKVTADSWNRRDEYYCMAKHSQNTKVVKLVKEGPGPISNPVVTMNAPVKEDLNANGKGTIVCVMDDFFPKEIQVKWFKNHEETTLNTMTGNLFQKSNGNFTLSSYITVSKKEWDEDTIFSCNVVHSGISETRNMSKSQTCEAPPVPGAIQVAVEPPSFETIFYNKKAPLTCIISNMQNTDGLDVSWYELRSEVKLETVLDNPVFQGSSYSIKAIASVCADDWYSKKFECRVKHPDLTSPKNVILAKDTSQTPQKPTVYLYGPHQDELNNKESLTLTCVGRSFNPPDSFIKWSKNDQVIERYVVTTKPMEEPYSSVNKSYFQYSTLTLPSIEDWNNGDTFTCTFGHEALPLQATQRSVDKTTGKPTSVNVSLVMSDSC